MNAPAYIGRDRLYGPDLDTLPSLAAQLMALDEVKAGGDVEEYAIAWLAVSDANGGGASAFWEPEDDAEAPAQILTFIGCDWQERERRARRDALHARLDDMPDMRLAVERELVRRKRFTDNRVTSLIEIKAVVRAFLATGGRLLVRLPQGGKPENDVDMAPATTRFARGDWSYADQVAARAIVRLCRRWKANSRIKRIVHRLGTLTGNGFIVLAETRS